MQITLKNDSLRPWLVCLSAALFFFYEFIQMNMLNSLGSYLMNEYQITATQLGSLSGWYFYANLGFLLVAGLLLDRFSTRKIILYAMGSCVIGTTLMAFSHSVLLTGICRFIAGIGGAFCFLSSIRLASRWFPPQRMALMTGLIVTMAMLGGVVAQTPLAMLAEAVGWRAAVGWIAGLGAVISMIVWKFVFDYPPSLHETYIQEQDELKTLGFWQAKRIAFLNKQNWLAGLFTSLLNLPVSLLGALWGNVYLQKIHHLSTTQAASVTMMIFVGTVIGSPLAGWISDRMGLRRKPMLIGAVLSLLLIILIIYLPQPSMMTLMLLFLGLGLITSTQVISYPTVAESNPKILTATSVSVVSISAIAGYPISQILFGLIMDWHWDGTMAEGMRVYSASNYQFAISIMPIAFLIALIAALCLRETHCKSKY
ncbi:MAG: MFS transporter [Gammaproteobacteria bacterium]